MIKAHDGRKRTQWTWAPESTREGWWDEENSETCDEEGDANYDDV